MLLHSKKPVAPATVDAFEDVAPDDLLDLFREAGLPIPNPLWYVGRLLPPKGDR